MVSPKRVIARVLTRANSVSNAQLPADFVTDGDDAYVEGLFVHATFENWGFSAASERVIDARIACRAKGRELFVKDGFDAFGNEEIWLYQTHTEVILFVRSHDARIDRDACTADPTEVRAVYRFPASVLDWPLRFAGDITSCEAGKNCRHRRTAGVRARCYSISAAYVGSDQCVSVNGPTRGMTVSQQTWQDDGQFEEFKVTAIRTNVRIDRSILTSSKQWETAVAQ